MTWQNKIKITKINNILEDFHCPVELYALKATLLSCSWKMIVVLKSYIDIDGKDSKSCEFDKKLCLSTQQILHKKFEFNIISQYIYILRFKSHLVFYPWYEVLVDISSPGAVWLSSPTWSSVVVLPYLVQCGCPGWRWHCREWRTPKIPGLMATLLSCSWNIIVVQILYWHWWQVYIYPIYLKIFQPWTFLAIVTVSRWEHPSIPDQSSDIFQPSGS